MEGTLELIYNDRFITSHKYTCLPEKDKIKNKWRLIYGRRLDQCNIIDVALVPEIIKEKSIYKQGYYLPTREYRRRDHRKFVDHLRSDKG